MFVFGLNVKQNRKNTQTLKVINNRENKNKHMGCCYITKESERGINVGHDVKPTSWVLSL